MGILHMPTATSRLAVGYYGGIISNNAGELIECADGTKKRAYPTGNNHGSIIEVNGQWYVFYHRMTGTDEFARQAMLDPIDVAVDGSGRVYIGRIEYNEARRACVVR